MTDSIYDQLNAYGTVAKQRFVENFSGSALDTDRWATNHTLSGTSNMSDTVNGGVALSTGVTNASVSAIDFNDIRQYSPTGSVMILVAQRDNDNQYSECYLRNTDIRGSNTDYAEIYHRIDSANIRLQTRDNAGSSTNVDTGVARNVNEMLYKLECLASTCELSLDGVLKATSGTNLPSLKLQAGLKTQNTSAADRILNVRYVECYNT